MKLKTHQKFREMVMDDLLPSEMDVMATEMPSFLESVVAGNRGPCESKAKCKTRMVRMFKRNPKKFISLWKDYYKNT